MTKQETRIWFITGASRGIGAELARAALAAGDAVVATARDPRGLRETLGPSDALLPVALDVTDAASIEQAVAAALSRFGRIDVLVNNAGYGLVGAVEEASASDVRKLYETNVFGLLAVTRAVLPSMRARRAGHVLNLSSVGGFRSGPGFGVYCSTKFAVEGLSEALHGELAPLGIRVTVVEPGYFRTEFLESQPVITEGERIADYDQTAGLVRERARAVSLNQPGDPVRLASALVALVRAGKAPLRLPLGSDTVAVIEEKLQFVAEELSACRAVALSTDFPT